MAISCGNCKGKHDTIQEVRQCHEVDHRQASGASPRQVDYIRSLLEKRADHGVTDVEQFLISITSKDAASKVIDRLLTLPKVDWNRPGTRTAMTATVEGTVPAHGTYTVAGGAEQHRTLRIKKVHPQSDRVVVEYLAGPDNSSDFRRFGDVVDGGVYVHNGFKEDSALVDALRFLLGANTEELQSAGYTYALASGNCYRCGRKLTVPASIHRGMGPVCASKEDVVAIAEDPDACTPGQKCKSINELCTKHQAQYQRRHGRASNE